MPTAARAIIDVVETPDIDHRYPRKLSGKELETKLSELLDTTGRGLVDSTVPTPQLYMSLIQLGVIEQARRQQRVALWLSAGSVVIACVAIVVSFLT